MIPEPPDAPAAKDERCNGLDEDGDNLVDEDFRTEDGAYVDDRHCGACGRACRGRIANGGELGCELRAGVPMCVARRCDAGFGPTASGGCAPLDDHLCLPCLDDGDCGSASAALCAEIGGERRCTRDCGAGCPEGYRCDGEQQCVPAAGSCSCNAEAGDFTLACRIGDAEAGCPGSARCEGGVQSACLAPEERCDESDNDCDGRIDEGFVDARGAYALDPAHCGACGVDCAIDAGATGEDGQPLRLTCGGDPFAPSCVTLCPDARDGIQLGDRLDADRRLENGCECTVSALVDSSGAPPGEGQLDSNCDGADGDVLASFYVATNGDDAGPGSPTRPLRTISAAVERARASLGSERPRPHVYVASGIYTESVHVDAGVQLHGGYRNDFLARSPSGFEVIVVAPADTEAPFGAALTIDGGTGARSTLIEGLQLRGRDAAAAGAPAVAVVIERPHAALTLRDLRVRAGRPGAGENGQDGAAGQPPQSSAADGARPRGAIEDAQRLCLSAIGNRVSGGVGGRNVCGGIDVAGGNGGSPGCPRFGLVAPSGTDAPGAAGSHGRGGLGGTDVRGPIGMSESCPATVCCGLADFTVPSPFQQSAPGTSGADGGSGTPGAGCTDAFGSFNGGVFRSLPASAGMSGAPGLGGGGGGGGGGAEIIWANGLCEFADGLGGGGGGGGAGGCGGGHGLPGQSGGPSVGILIVTSIEAQLPALTGLELITAEGGRGGDGGAGGDGAPGGAGGFGGNVSDGERSTPTLSGPMAGERGGKGGNGGNGGGGGGGCGGASVGIWIAGLGHRPDLAARFEQGNAFELGGGGAPGRGGSGWMAAGDGVEGATAEVVVR